MLRAILGNVYVSQLALVLKACWREAEALYRERPGKASGECAASFQEEVMERSRSLTPSSRVRVLEKWPEHVVQLHWRPEHFGDASVTGWLPRTVVAVE